MSLPRNKNHNIYRALVEYNQGIIALVDEKQHFHFRSSYAIQMTGCPGIEPGKDTAENIHPDLAATVKTVYAEALKRPGEAIPLISKLRYPNGKYTWLEGILTNRLNDPGIGGIIISLHDVTSQKEAEEKLKRTNRIYFFISQVNQMIVKTTDENVLFDQACKIAVNIGQFRMAWIGMINTETNKLVPVCHAGEAQDDLSKILITSMGDMPEERSPIGTALREGNYIVHNDIETAPEMAPWKDAALGRNYHSVMSLPIKKFGVVAGAFTVYASTKDFFDSDEIALLEEAVSDIAFALENIEKEKLRKKAAIALEESRNRYRIMTEVSPVGIFHTDATGYTTYVNPRWCSISGMDAEAAMGNGWFAAVHPDDKERLARGWEQASGNQETSFSEYRFLRPDGSIAWVMGHAIPERNSKNEIEGYVGTITEITDRKKSEEAIEELYKEKQTLLNRINDGVLSIDNEWRYTFLNDAALSTHPLGREGTIGKVIWDLNPGMKGTIFWDKYHEAKQTGRVTEFESFYPPMNAWFFIKIYPAPDGLTVFYNNITESKNAAEVFKRNEQKLDLIYNTTKDILYLISVKENSFLFTSVNNSFYSATGLTEKNVIGKFVDEIIPEPSLSMVLNHYRTAIAKKKTIQWEEVSPYPSGTKTGIVSITPVFDSNGECSMLVGSVHDITELNKANAAIKDNEEKRTLIMNAALDAIICIDTKGLITFWNPQAEKIFGWKENEVMGKLLSATIIPAPYAEMHNKGMENYLRTGKGPALNALLELKAMNRAGNEFPVELTVLPIRQGGEEFFCAFIRDITERKLSQSKIVNAEKKFRALIENSTDGLSVLSADGTILDMSPSGRKILGYKKEEALDNPTPELIHPDDFDIVRNAFLETVTDANEIKTIEYRRKMPDGTYKWLECSFNNLLNEPYLNAIVLNYRDITARKNAVIQLRESEERYRIAQAIGRMGHWQLHPETRVLTWSDEIYRMFGVEKDSVDNLYETFYKMIHPEDRDAFRKEQQEALSGKKRLDNVHRIVTTGGIVLHMHELGQLLYNDRGEIILFEGTVQDVTENIKAKDELINEKNLSDSVINTLPGIFYLYNRERKFLRWNSNFEKVTGYSRGEILQMHPLDFFEEGADRELLAKKIANTFLLGEDNVVAGLLLKNKEKVTYYFTGKAIDYRGEECLAGVGIDFTERVSAQEKIRDTTEQLRLLTAHLQSIREEERKRIGREIHDELGQQITAIKMSIAWIDKKIPPQEELIKSKLKSVISLLDGSNQSIRRILNELRPAILDDHGLLEALQWLGTRLTEDRNINFEFSSTETDLRLSGPVATCIFRVYQEALTNIIRHAGAKNVVAALRIHENVISVKIRDDGKGFDPAMVKTNQSFGIMGMKERLLSLGGQFELISSPGNGTIVMISLPL